MKYYSSWRLRTISLETLKSCPSNLNAISGTSTGDVLKLQTLVNGKVMLLLLDSGSTNSFVNSSFIQKVGIQSTPTVPKQVKVANGDTLVTDQIVYNLTW